MKVKISTLVGLYTILILSQATLAKGGGLVGNGAGFAEQNLHYAYNILPQIIGSCLMGEQCGLSLDQKLIAQKIAQALHQHPNSSTKFEFVSEKQKPNFFDLGQSEPHRMAKTDASTNGPIYFNTDVLNSVEATSRFTTGQAVAIVTHEMGHQIGELNHRNLDDLGAKLRRRSEANTIVQTLPIEGHIVEMAILQIQQPSVLFELVLYASEQAYNFSPFLRDRLFCLDKSSYLLGIELKSPSWHSLVSTERGYKAGFSSWARVICLRMNDQKATETFVEHKTVRASIDLELVDDQIKLQKDPQIQIIEGIQSLR